MGRKTGEEGTDMEERRKNGNATRPGANTNIYCVEQCKSDSVPVSNAKLSYK